MRKKTVPVAYLQARDAKDIEPDLRTGYYSLLDSLGCSELKSDMRLVGMACRKIMRRAEREADRDRYNGTYSERIRKAMHSTLSSLAPSCINGILAHPRGGIVIGFNHPTLGEIIRIIDILLEEYPKRNYLFPVNLPWYEELAPIATHMERFGLYIVPTITPHTYERMEKILDADTLDYVRVLQKEFNRAYLNRCVDFIEQGDILVVAPSAARQACVFRDAGEFSGEKPVNSQPLTLLAMTLRRRTNMKYFFMPIAVSPPRDANRNLNLFKKYRFTTCEWISPDDVVEMCHKRDLRTGSRRFEHFFLRHISDELHDQGDDYLIYPNYK